MGISLPTLTFNVNKRIIRLSFALAFGLSVTLVAKAQTGSVGIGTANPNPKAILDITSTEKGLLIPRLTIAKRNALLQPGVLAPTYNGMLVYVLDDSVTPNVSTLFVWKNDNWVEVGSGAAGLSAFEVWKSQQGNANKSLTDFFDELKGDSGDKGAAGATWFTEKVDPTSAVPASATDGDYYLNTLSGDIFKKTAGTWGAAIGNLIVGKPGADGKSVTGVSINGAGQLVLTVSDGITTNIFTTSTPVKGADGQSALELWKKIPGNELKDGTTFLAELKGADGLGIKTATVVSDSLRITLSNNSVVNAGKVKGTDGLGINGAAIVSDSLRITLSNNALINAGKVKGTDGLGVKAAAVVTDSLRITLTDNSIINAGKVKGTDGLGVKAAAVVTDSLRITLSDNSVINAGKVKGADGLGVKAAAVVTDSLRITLTDNSIINAGKVKGADGLGVKSAAVVTDSLRITLSDNSVINAGKVKGADGAPGSRWYAGTTNPDLNPSVASAIDGDMYFNGTTNTIWEKIGGTWTDRNIEINPTNAWSLKGNVGTTVPPEGVIADVISDFIGTADNTDFVIGTYSKEVIRVKTGGGNVGIGTSNPGAKLDVQGTAVIGVGGSIINKVLRKQFTGASSKAIPSLTKGASTTITFSMTGAAANGTAAISPTSFVPLPEGIIIGYARVASAGDNVEVKFYNVGTSDYVNLGTTYSFVVTVIQ